MEQNLLTYEYQLIVFQLFLECLIIHQLNEDWQF